MTQNRADLHLELSIGAQAKGIHLMPNVAVCICTHGPDPTDLARAIRSIADQDDPPFEVVLVDNASEPALSETSLAPLRRKGISSRMVVEPTLGLSYARLRGIRETTSESLLFVDDDNELFSDYIREGLAFIARNPSVGCFGGRLYLPRSIQPPPWTKSYWPWLGIKDGGDEEIINDSVDGWGVWEPPGAGSWVHRDVLNEYVRGADADRRRLQLGRRGRDGLASCDDSLLMRGAYKVGLANAYAPALKLNHHLAERRFRLMYLLRLMKAYGESHVFARRRPATRTYRSWLSAQAMEVRQMASPSIQERTRSARLALRRWAGRVSLEFATLVVCDFRRSAFMRIVGTPFKFIGSSANPRLS